MEDLLDIDEAIHGVNIVVIPPRASRIIKGQTSLILFGTKMNVVTQPLKKETHHSPEGYIYDQAMLGIIMGTRKSMWPCTIRKTNLWLSRRVPPVGHMVAANIIPQKVLLSGTPEALDQPKNNETQQLSI